jgi:hypothetical protein
VLSRAVLIDGDEMLATDAEHSGGLASGGSRTAIAEQQRHKLVRRTAETLQLYLAFVMAEQVRAAAAASLPLVVHSERVAGFQPYASFWAEAVVWSLAVFANCFRSEPIVSKRSGISPELHQRLLKRAESANAKRCPLVQSERSGSLADTRSQAAGIPHDAQAAGCTSAFPWERSSRPDADPDARLSSNARALDSTVDCPAQPAEATAGIPDLIACNRPEVGGRVSTGVAPW